MKKFLKVLVSVSLVFSSLSSAQAEGGGYFEVKEPPRAAEFIYRSSPKESLIGVQLMGAVKFPGIYYIPPSTDLLKLLTLAGGTPDGDLTEVLIRKTDPSQAGVYELDVKKLMNGPTNVKPFKLTQDDYVYVPPKESWISNDVSKTVMILSVVATTVLTGVLIQKNTK